MKDWREEYAYWLGSGALTAEEQAELEALKGNDKEIEDRFYAPLAFGTAGLRGVMGMGLNRMNVYIIRQATQAFAEVILGEGPEAAEKGVVIGFDCRNHGREFAREAACVMAANGVHVLLFENMQPTPELSFAIRRYGATAGINVTASHNPKEYNGYKVYWSDGAQLPPEQADAVAAKMAASDLFTAPLSGDFDDYVNQGCIGFLGKECDEAFLEQVMAQRIDPEAIPAVADDFEVVYTPFHGCGRVLVPEALRRAGLKHLFTVEEQMVPDGNFSTVPSPNPEYPESFAMAVELAGKVDCELIIGTDPDSDRVAAMVRRGEGYIPLTGNQMGVLLLDYIISAKKRSGTLTEKAAALTTIVSTGMARRVCEYNGVHFDETFTGFKFIAEKLAEYAEAGSYEYLMGFEESIGYMMGDYVRDKDAVTASLLITEMGAYWFRQGKTLADAMDSLYEKYGHYRERTENLYMYGVDGLREMRELMERLRANPPADCNGLAVKRVRDYLTGELLSPTGEKLGETPMKGSNVLYLELEDGSNLVIRPSGTEPKIKMYVLARGGSAAEAEEKRERIAAFALSLADKT